MGFFRELRVMVESILECLIPLLWALLLLGLIQWIFAVYFIEISTDFIRREFLENAAMRQDVGVVLLRTNFGSHWRALRSLYESLTGGRDWGSTADALLVTGYVHALIMYYFYIALTTFAVLNVVTGIFVENANKMTLRDRDLVIQDIQVRKGQYINDTLDVFHEADRDGSGALTFEEFESHLSDPRVQAFFMSLELEAIEARRLFRLLDIDETGSVDAEEFVVGCMCLKGGAKTMDVAALFMEVRRVAKTIARILDRVETCSAQPEPSMKGPTQESESVPEAGSV